MSSVYLYILTQGLSESVFDNSHTLTLCQYSIDAMGLILVIVIKYEHQRKFIKVLVYVIASRLPSFFFHVV